MAKKRKPLGWPRYMTEKKVKDGIAHYWQAPTWAKAKGYSITSEPLGLDYSAAKARCDTVLNPQFDSWLRGTTVAVEPTRAAQGTLDWAFAVYKSTPKFKKKPEGTRKDYDRSLADIADIQLKDGRRFGAVSLKSITGDIVDRIYERIKLAKAKPEKGEDGARTAWGAIGAASRAWNAAIRAHPALVPPNNPFAGVEMDYSPKKTRRVSLEELNLFVATADRMGEASIGTAAMIGYYWLVRQTDILNRLAWSHYRPQSDPMSVQVRHNKTGEELSIPLFDDDGSALWPELMNRLDAAPRNGVLICTRDKVDRTKKVHLPWREDFFRHRVAEIREAAGIDPAVKFMGLRHGGNTEGATAGLTGQQLRALSGHKSEAMTELYAQETREQRIDGARKRRDLRTKKGNLSE